MSINASNYCLGQGLLAAATSPKTVTVTLPAVTDADQVYAVSLFSAGNISAINVYDNISINNGSTTNTRKCLLYGPWTMTGSATLGQTTIIHGAVGVSITLDLTCASDVEYDIRAV